MSSKINISDIVVGHFRTLRSSGNDKISFIDLFTFILLPLLLSLVTVLCGLKLSNEMTSLLVNFGAIFTALLLSVLVLVYDQGSKIDEKIKEDKNQGHFLDVKKSLLSELYYNICYSIVVSISLVFLCLVEKSVRGWAASFSISGCDLSFSPSEHLLSPLVAFLTLNLMMTILMIVKRMHVLLTSN
ncbi:hypothetical protein CWB96_03780 [Pseudoalteromonas citrea]|uniref:Uncharacterized protein n=1 Tax=Pseudoalteromonas citrea TaxID=43655 RepID=A0A5S3XT05_9GAMM|nr:hypothetical protein [Pseudoalteromonas citrea]TMP45203.1 hypothetical protein CWB97_05230 [Pseudoalteromonas citrea]TMP61416.1 hypothetical protein CWB96_03780 [Pseudoalteromonas citrea]